MPGAKERPAYRLEVDDARRRHGVSADPYAFGPALGPLDDYLLRRGHAPASSTTGSARSSMRHEGVDGVLSPSGRRTRRRVSVVGDFNDWDGRRCQMRRRFDSGLWEIFIPDLATGASTSTSSSDRDGALLPLKADPFGFEAELRPSTASVVADSADFAWTDADYMARARRGRAAAQADVDLRGASRLVAARRRTGASSPTTNSPIS